MTRKRKQPPPKTTHSSPAVKAATALKRKYGTGGASPGKSVRARRAIIDVQQDKTSIRKAAKKHSVSVSFLRRRLSGEVPLDSRNGPSPVFNKKEEEAMATWLKEMAERGLGLRPGEFLDFVQEIVQREKRKTPFVNDRPSYKWYGKFMERNKHIVQIRIETPLEASRSKLTRNALDGWYCNYRDFLIQQVLLHKPNCIYNADETGFSMSSKAGKVIGPTRINQNTSVPHVSGRSKERITVMFCGCADGSMIPPFLVYSEPRPRSYNPLTGGIAGSAITFTKKGWMNSEAYEVFLEHFDTYACKDRPVVLLIDSVSSHISMNAFEFAKKNGILLYRLVPNATHLMQPLDKGVFGPLKQRWYQVTRAHSRNHPGVAIGKETFSEKLKEAYLLFYKPLTVLNSFKSSGIYPVDSTVITDENLTPGLTYNQSDDETGESSSKSKPTKFSQAELEAQCALRAFERALCTPTKQKYEKRIQEGYDVVGQSPCFDVYKKLKSASEGHASTSRSDKAQETPTTTSVSEESPQMPSVNQSGLDLLASAALQECDQMTLPESKSDLVVSPVLLESIVMPKSVKPKKMQPRRLIHDLPHHLTSSESIRTMALRELSKVKIIAEKEKRAKKKLLASSQKVSASRKIRITKPKDTLKPKQKRRTKAKTPESKVNEKFAETASTSGNIQIQESEETADDNEDVECKGCHMTWREDQELELGRTWVNCDECNMWMHYDCSSREAESDEPFCCPDFNKDIKTAHVKKRNAPGPGLQTSMRDK